MTFKSNSPLLYTITLTNKELHSFILQSMNSLTCLWNFNQTLIVNHCTLTLLTLTDANDHMLFQFPDILSRMILEIRKFLENSILTYQELAFRQLFCFNDTTDVNPPSSYNKGSPIPPNFGPTEYDFIMLDVDDTLPSLLTPPLLAPPVTEPVCELQTQAPFTMTHASPQPQSLDAPNYARVNPLPLPATFSSVSEELPLFIGSNSNSPTVVAGTMGLSQELLLQGKQPPPLSPPSPSS